MNRFPLWKNLLVGLALVWGALYTVPNFFGEAPAVQVSAIAATAKVDSALSVRVERLLTESAVVHDGLIFDGNSVKIRLRDTDTQLKVKDLIGRPLTP